MKTRTIRVQGHGSVFQAPDRIRISLTIDENAPAYGAAIEGSNERIAAIRASSQKCGIDPELLRTSRFDIRDDTEYTAGRTVHVGFIATHAVTVDLPFNQDLVGKFLSSLSSSKADPSVGISFSVSDPESLKQRVLADAVANATARAETIAKAAGIRLGGIENIEYGYAEIRVSSETHEMGSSVLCDSAPDIRPEAIDAEDTVTITWAIES